MANKDTFFNIAKKLLISIGIAGIFSALLFVLTTTFIWWKKEKFIGIGIIVFFTILIFFLI